ncbi:MAG: bile acid:sodium symporter family protein [Deltaproteobacteria bacterium]|nr:bile acid:sodium symporter family protein [Deltaproteobacteria bacterium]
MIKIDMTLKMVLLSLVVLFAVPFHALQAGDKRGETLYRNLLKIAQAENTSLFEQLNRKSRDLNWSGAESVEFEGNLRIMKPQNRSGAGDKTVYLLRKLSGEVYLLSIPLEQGPFYVDLEKKSENKLVFKAELLQGRVEGETYTFARLTDIPFQPVFDRIFKISIILMLFLIMVGMGMTLTLEDFAIVFKKPAGIFLGELLQFGIMPLLAFLIASAAGFRLDYPYIYIGFILIAVSPGGVTSNLMTHFAKGDLALSISLTSFSTVLSLFFTPFLLALYCQNIPEVSLPLVMVIQTIAVLVILPLAIGMAIRGKWQHFAEKATPIFSALGIVAVLFIMIAGVLSNLDKFADVERYGLAFYLMVFLLILLGMVLGGVIPRLSGINNYQTRAISLETGLRNSALAMTLAILIQDQMGDFYSSMFVVSGVFGLQMYVAGFLAIFSFKKFLPTVNE